MSKVQTFLRRIKNLKVLSSIFVFLAISFLFLFQNCSSGFESLAISSNSQSSMALGSTAPNLPPPQMQIKNIYSSPYGSNCALDMSNLLKCWSQAIAGVGTALPTYVDGLGPITSVSIGGGFGCAITTDQKLKCWGIYDAGQIGTGAQAPAGVYPPPLAYPGEISMLAGAKQVSAGFQSACALSANNQVYCWGQLSTGLSLTPKLMTFANITNQIIKVVATQVANDGLILTANGALYSMLNPDTAFLTNVKDAYSGGNFSCAVLNDTSIRCWGSNSSGELGSGTVSTVPPGATLITTVSGLINVKSLSLGASHACAVLIDGSVKCWGSNGFASGQTYGGQLGIGSTAPNSPTPVAVNIQNVREIAAGNTSTCAVLNTNIGYCWGAANTSLGTNDDFFSAKPIDTLRLKNYKSLKGGCGITINDQIDCISKVGVPGEIFALTGVKQLSHTYSNFCAIISSGQVKCWSRTAAGTTTVSNITQAVQIAAGFGHYCALEAGGTVKCWLDGAGFPVATGPTPTLIAGVTGATQIISGEGHSCALLQDSHVKCWGDNGYGQLGDGTKVTSAIVTPVDVLNLSNAISLSSDYSSNHTCALTSDEKVKCWGINLNGVLGRGSNLESANSAPQEVVGLSGATQVSSTGDHACALTKLGPKCWGANSAGQIGTGDKTLWYGVPTPAILSDKAVTSISVAASVTMYEFADGTKGFTGFLSVDNITAPASPLR